VFAWLAMPLDAADIIQAGLNLSVNITCFAAVGLLTQHERILSEKEVELKRRHLALVLGLVYSVTPHLHFRYR
jgi:hypothetical protein